MIVQTIFCKKWWEFGLRFRVFQFRRNHYTLVYWQNDFLFPTNANDFHSLIRVCKTTNLPGLDGLTNNVLEIAGPVLPDFLVVIFKRCFQVGFFPSILKIARIKRLFKTGDMQNPKNYHTISLLLTLSKIFETILVKRPESFWESCDVLNSNQKRFRKKTVLIDQTKTIRAKISESEKTICTFLDKSNALDTVNHGISLKKLEAFGARRNFLQLLASSLQNRKRFVQTDGKVPEVRDINVGVSQGSVLGPLMFLIYIKWDKGDTTCKFATCLFCGWLFDFDISPTQSFPTTWKAITSNQLVAECQQTYFESWEEILPKVRYKRINGQDTSNKRKTSENGKQY